MKEDLIREIKEISYITEKVGDNKRKHIKPLFFALIDSFIIVKNYNDKIYLSKKDINRDDLIDIINYKDITDIIFPPIKKIKLSKKKQFAVKILKNREYFIIGLSERSFFDFRKLYEDSLYPNSNKEIVLDFCNKTKKILSFLDENPTINKIFEYFVINKKILTLEEFFKDTKKLKEKLKKDKFEENQINTILQFINFDKVVIEERELILFTREDKLMLLYHFPEIEELYEKQNFGKFNDRKHEEAIFWNDFFMNQQKQNSFISGKDFINLKVKEKVSDFISKKMEKIEKKLEFNLNENFEDLTNIENQEKYLNVPKIEKTNVLNNINNYSLSILYKNINEKQQNNNIFKKNFKNGIKKQMEELKIEEDKNNFEEFYLYEKLKKKKNKEIILEPVSPLKRRNSFSINSKKDENNINSSNKQFTLYYKKYISKITNRVKEKISKNSITKFFENNSENNKIVIASINEQISKQLNSDELSINKIKKKFINGYFEKYENFNDNLKILLNIFYKLFPIDVEKNGKQIVNIAKKLQSVRNEIREFKRKLQGRLNNDNLRCHFGPLEELEKLIVYAFEKIKELT